MTSHAFADLEATIEKLPPFQLMPLHIKISHLLHPSLLWKEFQAKGPCGDNAHFGVLRWKRIPRGK